MRLESVRLKHLGPFDDYTLDLSQLGDARLIAICGKNGVGKSCLLELAIPGALYRTTPTRGGLTDLATARDAMLESVISVGEQTYTIRHLVDAISRNGESVVTNGTGQPVYKSTKVSVYDTFAARHFPTEEELFVSTFAPQGSAGFIGLTDGERKAVLLRVLGISRYEKLAEKARKRAAEKRNALATLEARIADERGRSKPVADADYALATAQEAVTSADHRLAQAREELADAQASASSVDRLVAEYAAAREKRTGLLTRRRESMARQVDLEARITNNRAVLTLAVEIRQAVADLERLRTDAARIAAEIATGRTAISRIETEQAALQKRRAAAATRSERAAARLNDRVRIEVAVQDLPEYETDEEKAFDLVFERQMALDAIRRQHVAGMGERVQGLRGGLEHIAAIGLGDHSALRPRDIAANTLSADDEAERLARELPEYEKTALLALDGARTAWTAAQQATAEARQLAARMPEILTAEADYAEAVSEGGAVETQAAALAEQHDEVRRELQRALESQTTNSGAIAEAEPLAKQAEALTRAETRIAELEPQEQAVTRELAGLAAEIEAIPEPPADPVAPDIAGALQRTQAVESEARTAHAALAVAERQATEATESEARLAVLIGEKLGIEADLADWNRLADDLGKSGLQALEIDAAGPELTARVNDLLHHCVGSRFSVLINTQPLSADGKRTLEGCEILVTDTVGGREAEASTFSGGERVIIGESISLALTMLGCQRTGVERPTLVRDETGAALDPENARAYVGMLRRAADFVGADRVLVVSHSPDVVALADARVQVQAA